jgi:hypothetical protein
VTEPTPTSSPPPAPAATGGAAGLAVGPGTILALVGAVALIISAFLDWVDFAPAGRDVTSKGTDVPFDFLWDKTTSGDPSFLLWLGIAAALLAVGALLVQFRVLGILGGVLAIVVVIVYCIQFDGLLSDNNVDEGVFDTLGIGVYIALAGGIAGLVGSLMPRNT